MTQSSLQHLHMAGIQGQGQIGHSLHRLQHLQHHGFLINAAHSHIHIQDGSPTGILLLGILQYHVHAAASKLLLELFLAGGINSLSHDHKGIFQPKGQGLPLAGQITDALRPPWPHRRFSPLCQVLQPRYIDRIRSAAAPQNHGSRRHQLLHLRHKGVTVHVVDGLPLFIHCGQTRIGLGNKGQTADLGHGLHNGPHLRRTGGTVHPDGIRPQTLQHNGRRPGIRAKEGPPVRLKGHGHHHRQLRNFSGCNQSSPGLPQAHHGLHHQQIHPCVLHQPDLLFIYCDQGLQIHGAHGPELLSCHGQIPGHQRKALSIGYSVRLPGGSSRHIRPCGGPARGLSGQGHQAVYHLFLPIL